MKMNPLQYPRSKEHRIRLGLDAETRVEEAQGTR
jgi:hypothetical protein